MLHAATWLSHCYCCCLADTANLAAILTDRARQGDVDTIIKALRNDYRFCADRKTMEVVINYFPTLLHEGLFVVDPDDGLPGFRDKRLLMFDKMDVELATKYSNYFCHAAIGFQQDLEAEQGNGRHCNKTAVGKSLGYLSTGFPLSVTYKPNLKALFSKMINLNVLAIEAEKVDPDPNCDEVKSQIRGETNSLSIEQLAGIWAVTFAFASMGLLIHYFKPWRRITVLSKKERLAKKIEKMNKEGKFVDTDSVFEDEVTTVDNLEQSHQSLKGSGRSKQSKYSEGAHGGNDAIQRLRDPPLEMDSPFKQKRPSTRKMNEFNHQNSLYDNFDIFDNVDSSSLKKRVAKSDR